MAPFDVEEFIQQCLLAVEDGEPLLAIKELVSRAVASPTELLARFPVPLDPNDDGLLYQSPDLTVASAIFPRGFNTGIHNHTMPAVIGVWSGSEDNVIYQRTAQGIVASSSVRVTHGEVLVLDVDAIHDVHVPSSSWSGALHVYLGDLVGSERSRWPEISLPEAHYDGEDFERRWTELAQETGLMNEH